MRSIQRRAARVIDDVQGRLGKNRPPGLRPGERPHHVLVFFETDGSNGHGEKRAIRYVPSLYPAKPGHPTAWFWYPEPSPEEYEAVGIVPPEEGAEDGR